jgi:hypothetical protein
MCVPSKKQRDKQKDTPVPQTAPQNIVKACMEEKHILVRLEVTGAVQVAGESTAFWEVQNDNLTIPVKAITSPDTPGVWPEILWSTGGVNADCNIVEVPVPAPWRCASPRASTHRTSTLISSSTT